MKFKQKKTRKRLYENILVFGTKIKQISKDLKKNKYYHTTKIDI